MSKAPERTRPDDVSSFLIETQDDFRRICPETGALQAFYSNAQVNAAPPNNLQLLADIIAEEPEASWVVVALRGEWRPVPLPTAPDPAPEDRPAHG